MSCIGEMIAVTWKEDIREMYVVSVWKALADSEGQPG